MTYTPDITRYQQIPLGGPTGPYDCTAWSAAILVDAHTQGARKLTGRQIRLATDEPVPDRASPGLNLPQVDAAVAKLTGNTVNLDTLVGSRALSRGDVQWRIQDGRWATIQVNRGVLVARGFLSGFRGGHALTVHSRSDGVPVIGDPLVSHYVAASWDAIFDAAEALTGHVYAQFTRDLTPDYRWSLYPVAPATVRKFWHYRLNSSGQVVEAIPAYTRGYSVKCTVPEYHKAAPGKRAAWSRYYVRIIKPGAPRNGWLVNAAHAKELNP